MTPISTANSAFSPRPFTSFSEEEKDDIMFMDIVMLRWESSLRTGTYSLKEDLEENSPYPAFRLKSQQINSPHELQENLEKYLDTVEKQTENLFTTTIRHAPTGCWKYLEFLNRRHLSSSLAGSIAIDLQNNKKSLHLQWRFFPLIAKHFLDTSTKFLNHEKTKDFLHSHPTIRKRLLRQCETFETISNNMLDFSLEFDIRIPELQLRLAELKQVYDKEYGQKLTRNAIEYSNLVQNAIKDFSWDQCKANLVGGKKFAIGAEARNFGEKIPGLKAFVVTFFEKGGSSWLTTWWLIAKRVSIIASFRFLLIASERASIAKQLTDFIFMEENSWLEKYSAGFSRGSPNTTSPQKYDLVFDLKNRQLVWLNHSMHGSNLIPMAYFELNEQGIITHAHYQHDSKAWDQFRCHDYSMGATYDTSIRKLVQDYQELLTAKTTGSPIDSKNCLRRHFADGVIVPCRRLGGVPLILPKHFQDRHEKIVRESFPETYLFSPGYLSYELLDTGELMLYADLQPSNIKPGNTGITLYSTLRKFSAEERECFRPDWTNNNAFDPTEFLLQSLYGGWMPYALGTSILKKDLSEAWKIPIAKICDPKESFGGYINLDSDAVQWGDKIRQDLKEKASPYTKLFYRVLPLTWVFTSRENHEILKELAHRFNIIHPDHLSSVYQKPAESIPNTVSSKYLNDVVQFRDWIFASPSPIVQEIESLKDQIHNMHNDLTPSYLKPTSRDMH